jgi:cytochrome b561
MPTLDNRGAEKVGNVEVYTGRVRLLHWLTVALIAVQVPVGIYMVRLGAATNFADPTATLYDGHKILGLVILLVVVVRLANRLLSGAPGPEPTIAAWQRAVSEITHWVLYAMLLAVAILGWLAISFYGPFELFGIKLPRLVEQNDAQATLFFAIHAVAAFALVAIVAMHVGAALMHYVVHKDNVLGRMWPALLRRRD